MKQILYTHEISGEVINLIDETIDTCFLVTPYFKPWPQLLKAFDRAGREERNIVFILRAGENKHNEVLLRDLNSKYNFDIVLLKDLHTKLYLNEESVIFSSMNLYNSSENTNIEIAYKIRGLKEPKHIFDFYINDYLFRHDYDSHLKGRFLTESEKEILPFRYVFLDWARKSISKKLFSKNDSSKNESNSEIELKSDGSGSTAEKKEIGNKGYCIRCRKVLSVYDPLRPYCSHHFKIWNQFKNRDYQERYCNLCGEPTLTSMNKPICRKCYNKYPWARPKIINNN